MPLSQLPALLSACFNHLSDALDRRSAPQLVLLLLGALFAKGRRTVTSWFRAAGITTDFRHAYNALGAAGRHAESLAYRLLCLVLKPLMRQAAGGAGKSGTFRIFMVRNLIVPDSPPTWAAVGSVASDTVLEQTQTVYDADSNAIETISKQRFHNATGTGALGSPTSGIGARVYYTASYFDNADRLIASVDAGTNGGTAWTRPSSVPTTSPTLLVTNYIYNAAGWLQDTTDPMGLDNRTYYDNLGQTTKTVQDYTNGTETAESNITTEYGYDGNGNNTFVQADEPGGTYQKTAYVYGVTTASGSGINSNDILSAVQHPDPKTGNPSATQQDVYQVNALGDTTQLTDRSGNVHQFSFDVLGRLTSDAVTALGTGVDGSIRRIDYAYDSQGNNYLVTSYDAATGGNIVNQVQRVYNGLGQLTGEYQSHSGAVVVGSTPEVQYAYTEMSGGQNNSRLVRMTYPSGYTENFNYNTGLDSTISRLSSISDSGGTLESYKYLGLSTVVERDHPQNNVNLSYIKQTGDSQSINDGGDQYTGLDRFSRTIDQFWVNGSTGAAVDRNQYGYNPDGDVLYRQNLVDAAMSELYQYDNLHQLTSFQRGTLNATHNGLVGSASRSQSWSPDALGNFNSVTTNGSTQTRTANQQNEITSISGSGTITYDANGNLTADGSGNSYVYDAWNRLVDVKNGSTTLAAYGYNGDGQRITETHGSTATDLYLSAANQVLEERIGGVVQARNVWGPEYVNELIVRDQSSQHNGVLDQRLYIVQDANWDVTALMDTSGNVLERDDYDPYGAVTYLNPDFTVRGTSAYAMLYLWQGERYDAVANLYRTLTRDVSPTLMRPLQADFAGLRPDNNDYRWAGNGPTDAVDPSGAWSLLFTAVGAGIGAVVGGGVALVSGAIHGKVDWADVGAGAAGGAVAGAVVGATAGALTGDPSTLIVGGAILGAAAGGAGGAAQSVAGDVLHGRPVDGGKALTSAAVDAVAGIVGGAVGGAVVVAGGGAIVAGAASGAAGGAVGGGLQAGLNGGSIVAGTLEGAALGVAGGAAAGTLCNTAQRVIPAPTIPAGPMKTVYTLGDVPVDVNRLPQAVPATQKVIPGRAYGGTYVQEANPLTLTPQQFHEFVSNNLPGNAFPKRLTVIEVPEGGVKIDPSVPNPPAGTGHIPPNSGARVTSVYEITYDQWGKPTFKKIE